MKRLLIVVALTTALVISLRLQSNEPIAAKLPADVFVCDSGEHAAVVTVGKSGMESTTIAYACVRP